MQRLSSFSLLASLMVTTVPAQADLEIIQEGIKLAPMAKPTPREVGYRWNQLKDGQPYWSEAVSRTGDSAQFKSSESCTWTRSDISFAPSTEWSNCSGANGTATVSFSGSEPYPLTVGKSWSFSIDGSNNGSHFSTDRDCEVEDAVRIKTALGEHDTFKVVCTDRWNTRTWYISTQLPGSVYFERYRRTRSERINYELVKSN